ncbi:MAG: DNA translocase FtsK [Oscillospiraceae bacterium]|nr:DNA translocase FtsK [Oscillospiraceae bacterium]
MAGKHTKKAAQQKSAPKSAPKSRKPARASTTRPRDVESLRRRNQITAIILFAVAVVLLFLVFIRGESVWMWVHDFILGMFGYLSIVLPVLLGYIAVTIAMGRSSKPRTVGRTILIFVTVALACSVAYIFQHGDVQHGQNFFQNLGDLYVLGMENQSAGLFSGLIGIPFVALMGVTGAKIVSIVALIVSLMLLTGTSLLQLFHMITKPTRKAAEGLSNARERREEKRAARQSAPPPAFAGDDLLDIPLDGEAKAAASRRKLENFKRAFEEDGKAAPEKEAETRSTRKRDRRNDVTEELDPIDIPLPTEPARGTARSGIPGRQTGTEPELEDAGAAAAAAAFVKKMQESQSQELEAAAAEAIPMQKETYRFPPVELLKASPVTNQKDITRELQSNGQKLVEVLKSFGVQTRIVDISRGPAVTRYELQPAAGVKISKITNLADDIAMNLAASGVRIEAPIPGKAAVGVEVPNKNVSVVKMRELIESAAFQNAKSKLTVALGRDISGKITLADLARMPHLLIAGATGSGKSVCINSLIISLLYKASPDEVKLLMVDPKVVELGIYNGIPHLLVPVVTDPRKAAGALGWAVTEMLNRYKTFADNNVRDLSGYNEMVGDGMVRQDGVKLEPMPQIVIIIDELADLMMAAPNEVEDSICRLAQMARAAGMHLVIATQRPSVDVITGVIKANIPSRIAFAVSSQIDSRTILDGSGAEKLLGRGDMLFAPSGSPKPMRVQGCFVDDKEVEQITSFVKKKHETEYDKAVIEEIEKNAVESKSGKEEASDSTGSTDPMMPEAIKCVVEAGQASTSLLQRRLRLGYARAGRLIDEMEQMGIVGPHEGSKPRQVLMTYQQYLEMQMQQNGEGSSPSTASVNEPLE